MDWNMYFWAVVEWAESRGYYVIVNGEDDCVDANEKIIEIDEKNTDIELRTYVILHEAGHVLVYNSPGDMKLLPGEMRNNKDLTKEQKVLVVEEEMEAWKRGKKLGRRLMIPINEEKWEKEKAQAITNYMKWAIGE